MALWWLLRAASAGVVYEDRAVATAATVKRVVAEVVFIVLMMRDAVDRCKERVE